MIQKKFVQQRSGEYSLTLDFDLKLVRLTQIFKKVKRVKNIVKIKKTCVRT